MRAKLAVCVGLLLLGPIAGMARAQPVYPQPVYPQSVYPQPVYPQTVYPGAAVSEAVLPPYEIMSIVRRTGLAPLTRPMRRGPYYVLIAVDRVGRQMRVMVDAQLGDIVNLRPALATTSYGPDVVHPYPAPLGAPLPEPVAPVTPLVPRLGSDNVLAPTAPAPRPVAPARAEAAPPPRSAPNPRPTEAPSPAMPATRTAVAEPPSPPPPPLPRPRPHLAANQVPASPVAPFAQPSPQTAAPAKDELIE